LGELARSLLCYQTKRGKMNLTSIPKDLEEEIADVFWQTLKLCLYLNIDLEEAFKNKYKKHGQSPWFFVSPCAPPSAGNNYIASSTGKTRGFRFLEIKKIFKKNLENNFF
jgi:hypothetical protein